MQTVVSARHMDLTDTIREHAERKCEKLPRYFDGVLSVEVVVEPEGKGGFGAEVRVDVVKHDTFVATGTHDDVYASIDHAVDRVARQLTDFKERLKEIKR